jgi:hypothetical protein
MTRMEITDRNRRNAGRSTGPTRPAGKAAAAARNAIRHGLTARIDSLPEADQQELRALYAGYVEGMAPVGAAEEDQLEQLAAGRWRLRRILVIESAMFLRYEEMNAGVASAAAIRGAAAASDAENRGSEPRLLADAFLRDAAGAGAFERLCRYRVSVERAMDRALVRLLQLQQMRLLSPPSEETARVAGQDVIEAIATPAAIGGDVPLADADPRDRASVRPGGDAEDADDHQRHSDYEEANSAPNADGPDGASGGQHGYDQQESSVSPVGTESTHSSSGDQSTALAIVLSLTPSACAIAVWVSPSRRKRLASREIRW